MHSASVTSSVEPCVLSFVRSTLEVLCVALCRQSGGRCVVAPSQAFGRLLAIKKSDTEQQLFSPSPFLPKTSIEDLKFLSQFPQKFLANYMVNTYMYGFE